MSLKIRAGEHVLAKEGPCGGAPTILTHNPGRGIFEQMGSGRELMNTRRDAWPYKSDWESLSPLRQWLIEQLGTDFPESRKYYDHERVFFKWTKMNHASCVSLFNRSPPGTTCTSFLTWVHKNILSAGTLSGPPFSFNSFALNVCGANNRGWHTLAEGQKPQSGDFYQQSNPTKGGRTQHVGVLLYSFGPVCTVVGGGADQGGYGAILRKDGPFPPQDATHQFTGWLNIDEFYPGWTPN
ncbi:hypothetical protein [Tropicimonas sp. IMCC6043]|uniref:hypothetical protein n=1 Tax=Tropicimonas sp. IMCC6043 TaxID=2510645 RepID=UPI00101C1EDA|nr:hypothetical protein [Tropicimonas sp. IMCC6043]RYH12408.1 hypothetical protein EU800_02295 [Tropicimonas sp. IMCC6043]